MCTDSAHVANRTATSKEDLVVRHDSHYNRYVGLYPAEVKLGSADDVMVCFISNAEAIIKKVEFDPIYRGERLVTALESYVVKENVPVTLLGSRYDYLRVRFPNGNIVYAAYFAKGTRITVGMPVVNTNKGVASVEGAISEATKVDQTVKATEDLTVTNVVTKVKNFFA